MIGIPEVPVDQKCLKYKVPLKLEPPCLDVNWEFQFCDGLNGAIHIDFVNPAVYELGIGIPFDKERDDLYQEVMKCSQKEKSAVQILQ